MFANLPMYDWPEIRDETDAFWRAMAERLGVDFGLDRSVPHDDSWRRTDLLFSQTCGYPLTHEFKGLLTYVATPHYAAEGCDGPLYSSSIFARQDCTASNGKFRAAVNSMDSMSGMLALRLVGPAIDQTLISGNHVRSLEMLQENKADVCAIDAVCVMLAKRHRPWLLKGLHEIVRSPSVPGLPFVTRNCDVSKLRVALDDVFADTKLTSARSALFLAAVSDIGVESYQQIIALEKSVNS
jgi:ABC-type phosphate/phosphonate transport system substrate-binding protein